MDRGCTVALFVGLALFACKESQLFPAADAGADAEVAVEKDAAELADAGEAVTCTPCLTSSDCAPGAACVQYGGSDYCAVLCTDQSACGSEEACSGAVADDGAQVSACIPTNGSCGGPGCGECPAGSHCDQTSAECAPDIVMPDGGSCGTYDPPETAACCSSCGPGQPCQNNGCYNGWWCDRSACRCHRPPSCGVSDGGLALPDAGPPLTGSVGPEGGEVSRLYFAVVGDTRPPLEDDTANYPTAIITKIYQDLEAMNPRPQFAIATGDYMFASPNGTEGSAQLQLYLGARSNYSGTVFAAMGNHECTGYTNSNCPALETGTSRAFMDALVTPLGKTTTYYTVPFADVNGTWTAKLIVVACNAWDDTQKAWLAAELARSTTYTIVTRHEPFRANAPCNDDMDPMLDAATYDLLIVGHTHTYSHSRRQLVEGVGGAPISGSANYGYAIIEQQPTGRLQVTQYDYQTAAPVDTYTVP